MTPGQWVLVDSSKIGILVEHDHGKYKLVGEVIINAPHPTPPAIVNTKWRVDLVSEDGETSAHILVDEKRITPAKRSDIPQARLRTMRANWTP